ncbi:MAG: hypothetical protein NC906_06065, partial [Candidatus Omnitrophica bacterium]|nr:hypothetical protein [Candidatus Omnitrophota bacterium]
GWETLKDVPPLNCARWSLYQRSQTGWKKLYQDNERTIEPAPICILGDGRTFVSENPFMQEPEVSWGVTLPKIMIFCPPDYIKTKSVLFRPCEPVVLTEHSYRNFAADRKNSELFLYHSDRWN